MTVKELKDKLSYYKDDTQIEIDIDDNNHQFTYTADMYDFGVIGSEDVHYDEFGLERNPKSDVVTITLYR